MSNFLLNTIDSRQFEPFVLDDMGKRLEAGQAAAIALEASRQTESGFQKHRDIGLVVDPDEGVQRRLASIADSERRA